MQFLINRERNKIKRFQILNIVDNSKCLTIIEIRIRENLFIDFQAIIDNIYAIDYKRRLYQYLFKY